MGILAWSRQVDGVSGRNSQLVWTSVWFGLAALTKNQLTLILAPTFVLLFLADRFYYWRLSVIQTALPFVFVGGGAFAGQFAPLLPLVGADGKLGATLALARQASAGAIFVFLPDRILSSLKFLLGADAFAYWAVPGLLYGLAYAPRDAGTACSMRSCSSSQPAGWAGSRSGRSGGNATRFQAWPSRRSSRRA